MMGLGGLGLDKQLGAIMNANRANPAALQGKIAQQQKAGVTPQLLEVLASQKLLKEKQEAKTALMASQQQNPATIAQQQDQALRQGAMADLQREVDVAKQVGMANNMKARQRQKAMTDLQKMLTGGKKPRGIAGAPVSKPMKAAQGGIVGFQSGNSVDLPFQIEPKPPIRLHTGVIERQRERREWDELYGDNYNTDGTLKNVATPSNIVAQNLNEQGRGLPALTEGAEYLPGDRRIIPKGPDFATQKFLQGMPTGKFEETGITPPMPIQGPNMPPPMQGPPMPPPSTQQAPEPPSTEVAPQGIKSLQYQPKDNLAAVLRAFQGGNPAAVASLLGERDRQNQLAVDKFNIESDLKLQKLENDRLATQINKELRQAIERGENRNALFGRLNTAQKLIQNATEAFDSSAGMSLKARLDEYAADYASGPSENKLKRYQAAQEAYNQALNRALGDLPTTADAIREAIARLDFDTSRPATQI